MHVTRILPGLSWILLLLPCLAPVAASEAVDPGRIEGLEAWYRADAPGLEAGAAVALWPDASGRGHDLVDDRNGLNAVCEALQINDLPAVRVGKANSHSVTEPFELGDHTIFVVFRTSLNGRALFGSDTNEFAGVELRGNGLAERLQHAAGKMVSYGSVESPARSWSLTVLGREAGRLREFVDGVDRSSGTEFGDTIRVGRFFQFSRTRFVRSDGEGLRIAEMLFFRRFLPEAERQQVTRYLAEKYGLAAEGTEAPPEPVFEAAPATVAEGGLAQLSTTVKLNVNEAMVALPWDRQDELDPPFEHDAEQQPTRLVCGRDETRVRLYVSLPLEAAVDGINVRVLFRVNGALFLRGEGSSGPFGGPEGARRASARAEVVTTLNAGDYVEVVTLRAGAAGNVTIEPDAATFIAETR
jgi:hypothetical protein